MIERIKFHSLWLVLLLGLGLSPVVNGKDMEGRHAVFAVGGESCAPYLEARMGGGKSLDLYNHFIL
ncbi:MAG: hypothetical protein HQL48_08990, partial [Gammaproteobacteria bacterium]|nr:hypothetical protein [Gammaproteobacteria bacterium]